VWGGGRPLLLLLHESKQSFVFTVDVHLDQQGIVGAEVNVCAQGCWSAGLHSQEWGVGFFWRSSEGDYYSLFFACASGAFASLDDAITFPGFPGLIVTGVRHAPPPEIPTVEKCDILMRFQLQSKL
jgi:hypothetical protein